MFNKKNISNFELARLSKRVIDATIKDRIPKIQQPFHLDDDPKVISQVDMFSGVDQVNVIGTRLYKFQNKSRNLAYDELCIECVAYRGHTLSPVTGHEEVPISGGYFFQRDNLWLVPNFKEMEILSVYLPRANFVGLFSRFILDVLFSDTETWKNTTGIQPIGTDRYCVFFKYTKFVELYLRSVIKITTGNDISLTELCNRLILNGNAIDSEINNQRNPRYDTRTKQKNARELSFF